MNELDTIRERLRQFSQVRDWDKFHSPKNLSMALAGEAGELLEIFQWLTEEQSKNLSPKQKTSAEEELADIFLYLICIADRLNINLLDAANKKITINNEKYPADKVKGSSKKYTEY